MYKFFDYFDAIYCINLEKHKQRKEDSKKEFTKVGIEDKVMWFKACEHTNGEIGCMRSHVTVIKEAIEKNLNTVLIFEDDIKFLDPDRNMELYLKFLENNEWDMFYLGGWTHERTNFYRVNEHIIKLNKLFGTVAYALNKTSFNQILKRYEDCESLYNDNAKFERKKHVIDVVYAYPIQTYQKCYGVYPLYASTREHYGSIYYDLSNEEIQAFDDAYNTKAKNASVL